MIALDPAGAWPRRFNDLCHYLYCAHAGLTLHNVDSGEFLRIEESLKRNVAGQMLA